MSASTTPAAVDTPERNLPTVILALLMALVLPPGVAHGYVGLWKRGGVLALVLTASLALGMWRIANADGTAVVPILSLFTVLIVGRAVVVIDVVRMRSRYVAATVGWAILRFVLSAVIFGGLGLGTALLLRARIIETFKLPSIGMAPTLVDGDIFFVEKRVVEPRRGDIMVFRLPEKPEYDFVQRVIGLPGDRVEMRDGHPVVNGEPVPSCLVGSMPFASSTNPNAEGDVYLEALGGAGHLAFYDRTSEPWPNSVATVKSGEYFTLGDNRWNSFDSRMWFGGRGGGVPLANMKGRASFIWLSLVGGGPDWSRTFQPVLGATLPRHASHLQAGLEQCRKELGL